MERVMQGKIWKFPENIAIDVDLMDPDFMRKRVMDPVELAPHVFESLRPEFAKEVQPGDIIVAGKRFGHGNPHIQGYLGLKHLGIGIVAESMPRGSYRNAIKTGIWALPTCIGVTREVNDGDNVRVDFEIGEITLLKTGRKLNYPPMPAKLREIVGAGGTDAWIKLVLQGKASIA